MKKLILFLLFSLPLIASAYIPPYWMIMSRVAENHGNGIYRLDQKVSFSHGEETLSVRERWYIRNAETMRLEVTGLGALKDKIRLTFVYTKGRRHYVDPNGVKKSSKISDLWLEPYFHFRKSKLIKPMLVARKVAPAASLESKAHVYTEENPTAPQEEFVRLARTGGSIAYALGELTPVNGDPKPGIWVEQDQFHILKIRFPDNVEVQASNYGKHGRGLWFPADRRVQFDSHQVEMSVSRLIGLSNSKKNRNQFQPASLQFGKDPGLAVLLPEDQIIRDFYKKLR